MLRLAAPVPASWLAIYRDHPRLPFHTLEPNVDVSVYTGETRWRVLTDAAGFRVANAAAPAPQCTALWLGDSFTFGHGVDYEDSFVGRLAGESAGTRHLDAGVPSYGPVQYRRVLEDLLARGERPRFVTAVVYVGNDFHDCVWEKGQPVRNGILGDPGGARSFLKRNLHLYRLGSAAFHRLSPAQTDPYARVRRELADPSAWQRPFLVEAVNAFAAETARLAEAGSKAGARVRFVILPTRQAVDALRGEAKPGGEGDPLLPVAKAREWLGRIDAELLDASEALRREPTDATYFRFDGHLTPEGHRLVAEAIAERWPFACE